MIINEIQNIEELQSHFNLKQKLKIDNFLDSVFAEKIYQHIYLDKNWSLATGIDKMKYEKKITLQYEKANALQIKNVNSAFGNDNFTYIFNRSMNNNINISYYEFTLRKILNSKDFIDKLNEITNLNLTKLTTLFLSKYKSGNFLSPHSDKGNGKLAFVIYLTKFWKPQYGGILHFMSNDRKEIIESYVPTFNSFIIFKVPEHVGIPHFISHVSPNVKYPRFAITGWFD
jgi:Rps23 Pro-64 3,4-dihydroxylase Tpa1-like proline 4-hydroxylase